jgi:hypothetical protein
MFALLVFVCVRVLFYCSFLVFRFVRINREVGGRDRKEVQPIYKGGIVFSEHISTRENSSKSLRDFLQKAEPNQKP